LDVKTSLLEEKHRPPPPTKPMDASIPAPQRLPSRRQRCVAMSGTGNGDSFLRTNAVHTSAAMCRFDTAGVSLADAVTRVAGPGGELQRSAGDRWGKTGEGEGGIIGIELLSDEKRGRVVFDFNCGGMWRAWIDEETGRERVMVFREEYEV
jgi:L-asparaginase